MATYLADKIIVFDGTPSRESWCTSPEGLVSGMNKFLKLMDITFRRDPTSFRPRINKYESQKDQEQKLAGNYYLLDELKYYQKEEEKTGKKKPVPKATTDSSLATMGTSGLPEIESHFEKQEKDSDDAQAKSKKKSMEEEKE